MTLVELDASYSARIRIGDGRGVLRALASLAARSGDSWLWLPGLGLVWLLGNGYWRYRALALGAGILATAVVVAVIKFSVKRRRPAGEWGRIYRHADPHSFPSGHAARMVMLGVVMLGLGPGWCAVLLLAWAPLVGLARVMLGVHYLSDVLAGAAAGVIMGLLALQGIKLF